MPKGAPITPALVQYFMSRVGQPVKLADIKKAIGEENDTRVKAAIRHLVAGSLPSELGSVRVIARSAVWQLDPPPMPDPAKDYDAWAEATSAAEITEMQHTRWVESGSTLPFETWRQQPKVNKPIPGPPGTDVTGVWSDENAPDPRWPSTDQANPLLEGLLDEPEQPIPTQKDWLDAGLARERGVDRPVEVLAGLYAKSREEGVRQRALEQQARLISTEKPAGAFTTPETMFQRVGTTEDNQAILKDEDGNFWRATRI